MILVKDLKHIYNPHRGDSLAVGVNNVNLRINKGEMVAVIGASGAGKSTFLRCMNRLLEPTSGEIFIEEEEILHCSEKKAQAIRRKMGMVFQDWGLLKRSPVLENVLLGRLGFVKTRRSFLGKYAHSKDDISIAMDCLRRVGLEDLAFRRADSLSGGQQQRVGIARALAQKPSIILADEPVSNLDSVRKREIMDLFSKIHQEEGLTLVISLHDIDIAQKYAQRIIGMVKGEIVFDGGVKDLTEEKIMEILA